ncbi:SprB repeat-containing protein [Flavobacterium sp. LM4]|uniref:SprB repeat-containing protein n=1 Tax=Flavobacterium sp. LM4 TaxID=1938609 RepID=UPI000994222B|nr:SprB repeat-containing protein [Flavobacterium sp. LM4]OOV17664.1 hypothetical protein BXU10_16515 [Flavobacterium sp. LM4]
MKKIYVLIIVLVSGFGFGQTKATYTVEFKNLDYRVYRNVKNHTSSHFDLTLKYTDGTTTKLYGAGIGDNSSTSDYSINTFTTEKIPKSINYDLFVNFSSTANIGDNFDISTYPCITAKSFSKAYDGMDVSFEYDIRPNLQIIQTEYDLPTDKRITIASIPGFNSSYYNWQYSLDPTSDPSSWTDLPQYNGMSSFSANAVDILGSNIISYVGKPIYFRQKACSTVSSHVKYDVRLSAPKINSLTRVQPTCSDSEDGYVKLVFNRTLFSGEQLNYTLLDVDTGMPANYNGILSIAADKTFVISGLRKGNYTLQLIGFKDGLNTSVVPQDLFALTTFTIASPPVLDFTLNSTNVQCYGSQDGTITIAPTGGTRTVSGNDYYSLDDGMSWIPFPNDKPYTITGLAPGTYNVKVKDMNGCIAKIQTVVNGEIQLGDDKVLQKTISQPALPLTLHYTFKKDPTFYGAANGKLTASISGGTINDDKSYDYEWKNSFGDIIPATAQYNTSDKTYNITLENAPEGEYKLTVKDKNYNNASNKAACSIIESSQILSQPDKIVIALAVAQAISCNTANLDSDVNKFSDGILKATVTGGVPFVAPANNGLPYKFIWSKYNTSTNLWEELTDYKTDTADQISQGNYSLNIIDANGIVQGTYNATDLVTAVPTTKEIAEPTKLELSFTSGNVSCHEGNNGWATANVTGGSGTYTYTWYNTGNRTIDQNKIAQLTAGEYFVEVTDAKGCFIKSSIIISEPAEMVKIDYEEIFTPTFSGATNGRIIARITGGTPKDDQSYNYQWKNAAGVLQTATAQIKAGIYTITLNGVPADDYFLTITDKNYNEATNQISNCSVLESKVTLNQPDPLKVVFEIVRTISCNTSNEFGNDTDTTPKDGKRDESQDGILTAHVSGGTPLASSVNNGLPYYFYWKKQQADGSWTALPDITGETAVNLSHGNYALT